MDLTLKFKKKCFHFLWGDGGGSSQVGLNNVAHDSICLQVHCTCRHSLTNRQFRQTAFSVLVLPKT